MTQQQGEGWVRVSVHYERKPLRLIIDRLEAPGAAGAPVQVIAAKNTPDGGVETTQLVRFVGECRPCLGDGVLRLSILAQHLIGAHQSQPAGGLA